MFTFRTSTSRPVAGEKRRPGRGKAAEKQAAKGVGKRVGARGEEHSLEGMNSQVIAAITAAVRPAEETPRKPGRPKNPAGGSNYLHRFGVREVYHLVKHSNFDRPAFPNAQLRVAFLHQLAFLLGRHRVYLHGFALLKSEVHLLVERRTKGSVPKLMQELQTYYARLVNTHTGMPGNFWRSGYSSRRVTDAQDYRATIEYIETAPEVQHLTRGAGDYLWSSAYGRIAGADAVYPWTRVVGSAQLEERFQVPLQTSRFAQEFPGVDWRAFLLEPDYREQVRAMERAGESNTMEERERAWQAVLRYVAMSSGVAYPKQESSADERQQVILDSLHRRVRELQRVYQNSSAQVAGA